MVLWSFIAATFFVLYCSSRLVCNLRSHSLPSNDSSDSLLVISTVSRLKNCIGRVKNCLYQPDQAAWVLGRVNAAVY